MNEYTSIFLGEDTQRVLTAAMRAGRVRGLASSSLRHYAQYLRDGKWDSSMGKEEDYRRRIRRAYKYVGEIIKALDGLVDVSVNMSLDGKRRLFNKE